jgi:predicted dehydrogenase
MMLRFTNGAKGMLWSSQVSPGNENALRIRIYGEKGGLEWAQENPNLLVFSPLGQSPQRITRGGHGAGDHAAAATRIPPGHPEGYLEAFAQLYSEIAGMIHKQEQGETYSTLVPSVEDGVDGVRFISRAVESSSKGGNWIEF